MKLKLVLAVAALMAPTAAPATPLADSIRADMPQLMALYRDLHANPELSMQEVRTPAKLAPEMRKLGFDVTEHVGKTGVVAVMKNGPGPVLLIRADMDALPVREQTGLPFASTAVGKLPDGSETPVMHACGHDTHVATWLGTARRLAAMKDQWSGTVVMILQPGEERVMGAKAMLEDGLFTRFPKPDTMIAFHDSADPSGGHDRDHARLCAGQCRYRQHRREGRRRAWRQPANDERPDRPRQPDRDGPADLGQPRERPAATRGRDRRKLPCRDQEQHHFGRCQARLVGAQLYARDPQAVARRHCPDRTRRGDRGRLARRQDADCRDRAAVGGRDLQHPAAFESFGASCSARTLEPTASSPPSRSWRAEDFSRYWLADTSKQSTMFWVGGVPQAKWDGTAATSRNCPRYTVPFGRPMRRK